MSPEEAGDEMHRLSGLIDKGLEFLREQVTARADAENSYRKGKAEAWVTTREGTAAERSALVDAKTADLRRTRDIAEGMERAALEAIRARRAQVSAVQSLLAAHRAEAEFVRTT